MQNLMVEAHTKLIFGLIETGSNQYENKVAVYNLN